VLVETPLYGETILNMPKVRSVYDAQRKWAEETLEARAADLRQRGMKASYRVQVGVPFEEIVRVAGEERADMIVMGTHGRSGLNRALLGSVAERVIRLAPCPVLTVRQTAPAGGR
jgi:nucleotide-binding universal stress UspA family protein